MTPSKFVIFTGKMENFYVSQDFNALVLFEQFQTENSGSRESCSSILLAVQTRK
jgi:hypothetical protein